MAECRRAGDATAAASRSVGTECDLARPPLPALLVRLLGWPPVPALLVRLLGGSNGLKRARGSVPSRSSASSGWLAPRPRACARSCADWNACGGGVPAGAGGRVPLALPKLLPLLLRARTRPASLLRRLARLLSLFLLLLLPALAAR